MSGVSRNPEKQKEIEYKNKYSEDDNNFWRLIANEIAYHKFHKPPLVSVIITAYNYELYIEQCLQSVYDQTYQNFECIVVDDHSRDSTRAVAEATLRRFNDDRFSIAAPNENLGQLGAQVLGFGRSRGQFIVYVDADDVLHSNFLERHLFAHLNLPAPVAFTSSDQWHMEADGTLLSFHHPDIFAGLQSGCGTPVVLSCADGDTHAMRGIVLDNQDIDSDFSFWWWGTQSTMMFRRGVLGLILPGPEEARKYRICADFYLARFAHILGASAILQEALGSYRRHGRNNFCSDPLLANVSVGDMRRHPKLEAFYALALHILHARKELYLGLCGQDRFKDFDANFRRNLRRASAFSRKSRSSIKWRRLW